MAFLQVSGVGLAFGEREILRAVNLNLGPGSRVALTGANGSGKTTLMRIMAGTLAPDRGQIIRQKDSSVSYLPQSGLVHAGRTLLGEAETAFNPLRAIIERMEQLAGLLEKSKEDDQATRGLIETHHLLAEHVEESGYYRRSQVIDEVLIGLGFERRDFHKTCEDFSGGWQMRIALAKILLEHPDILLLDEPTNYLDIEARQWLEGWIASFRGAVLLVSHDRYFLDVTVNETAELWNGRLNRYKGNYSDYERRRAVELEAVVEAYERQQEEIAKHEEFIRRFRFNASKAAMAQSHVKMLEKIERIEIPESLKRMHFSFPAPPPSGRTSLRLEDLGKCYGELAVLAGLNLELERGDRLAVVGKNGAGKSTLMRILAGRDGDYRGRFSLGSGVKTGYYAQEADEQLDEAKNVIETIEAVSPTELVPKLRGMLGAFLFRGDDIYKSVAVLSGGEKSRLVLLGLLLKPTNLLVLDEPTNHLDLSSKDVLLEAMISWDGTLVFVSHDRWFLDKVATKVLELRVGLPPRLFPGDYAYYRYRIKQEELSPGTEEGRGSAASTSKTAGKAQLEREESKRLKALMRRLEREEGELLDLIDRLESEHAALQARLGLSEVYTSGEEMRRTRAAIAANEAGQAEASARWELAAAEREAAERELGEG